MTSIKDYAHFFFEAVARPIKTGAVAPSSRKLAERMLEKLDPPKTALLLEVGTGTGAITRVALEKLKDKSHYIGFDINEKFIDGLRMRYPGVKFVHDSVENIAEHLGKDQQIDYIVCSLPWAIWPPKLQAKLLTAIQARLKPGGWFCTYTYLPSTKTPAAGRFRELLESTFSEVHKSRPVWYNLPPAVVYQCVK